MNVRSAALAAAVVLAAGGAGVGIANILDEDPTPERPRCIERIVGDDETAHKVCRVIQP